LPDAAPIADRWHLMENSSRAFLDAVRKSMRHIRQAVGSNVVDPKLLTYAEKLRYERYLRRQEMNEAVRVKIRIRGLASDENAIYAFDPADLDGDRHCQHKYGTADRRWPAAIREMFAARKGLRRYARVLQ